MEELEWGLQRDAAERQQRCEVCLCLAPKVECLGVEMFVALRSDSAGECS